MPHPAACCTSTNKNQEPFPDDFQAKCKRPSWLRELRWAAGLTLHLHSKGGWDETSEGGKRKNCISVLPSSLCEQNRRRNFFGYCGTYKIWEVGGRSQCCNAEMTSYRRLVGVVGFSFAPGMINQFWLPQEPDLCFETLCLSFSSSSLLSFLPSKIDFPCLAASLPASNWSYCSLPSRALGGSSETGFLCIRLWAAAGSDVIVQYFLLRKLLCVPCKKMVSRTEASPQLTLTSGLQFRSHWIKMRYVPMAKMRQAAKRDFRSGMWSYKLSLCIQAIWSPLFPSHNGTVAFQIEMFVKR